MASTLRPFQEGDALIFNTTGSRVSRSNTVGSEGGFTPVEATSLNPFECSLQPVSSTEALLFEREAAETVFKVYYPGYDSAGASLAFLVNDRIAIGSVTYECLGVSMDMAGRGEFFKVFVKRTT